MRINDSKTVRKISPWKCAALRNEGAALVMTLAMVTILSIILLAYFNVVRTDWMATKNYAQGIRAEQVGRGAIDYIVGQLRMEMADGTVPLKVGSYYIYTNVTSANVQPSAIGTNSAVPTLIKMSTATLGLYSKATPTETASSAASDATSANGRRVSRGRWARPGLGTPSRAPDWFLIGSDGIVQTPSTSVQGRFAFAIYDLGGLVDINVAGYPSLLSTAQRKKLQGTLAGLDLSAMPGFSQSTADALVSGFRNRGSAASAATYTNFVLNIAATNGFLRVAPGDDSFISRQDLLAYAKLNGLTAAMTNITSFTRTINTPSWGPSTNAGSIPIQTLTRSSITQINALNGAGPYPVTVNYNYQSSAVNSTSTNRFVLSQSVPGTFTRIDDTPAVVGEPLILKRFPLSRLAWLSKDGPSTQAVSRFGSSSAASNKIKAAFGLVWDASNRLWVYTSPTSANGGGTYTGSGNSDGPASSGKAAKAIKTLATVASEKREPDFFELLQAGVLSGSLGQRSSIASPVYMLQPGEVTPEGHLFQIGANIIDQYDEDDYPTLIRVYMPVVMDGRETWDISTETRPYVIGSGTNAMTPHDFAGVENLPYLMDIRARAFRPQLGETAEYKPRPIGEGLLVPQFWNPHQNATTVSSQRPSQLRLMQTFGKIYISFMGRKNDVFAAYETYPACEWPSATYTQPPSITFNGSLTFAQPAFLKQADVSAVYPPENLRPAIKEDAHTKPDLEQTGMVGLYLGRTPAAGSDDIAITRADQINDNTPIDWEVWAHMMGSTSDSCPVQQFINMIAVPCRVNQTALPSGDRFWKGDTTAASLYNQRCPVFELQYLDGGVWKTYQRFDGFISGGGSDHKADTITKKMTDAPSFTSEMYAGLYARLDPRGSRFGLIYSKDPANQYYDGTWTGDPSSYRSGPPVGIQGSRGRPAGGVSPAGIMGNQSGAQFVTEYDPTTSNNVQWTFASYWQWLNNIAGGEHYTDCDQILRRADGNTGAGVNPLTSASYRPIILNRAFTSVADLGYVFRDLPFKTLDFFSAESGDKGLLDLFCINESSVISAGVINLNGRNASVLAQVLAGAVKEEMSGSAISSSEAQSIAQGLVKFTGASALTGIADLPRFLPSSDYTGAVSGDLRNVKEQMEAVSRRLTGVADARCWNLLIDVVAQSGFYPKGVTDPNQFIVQGERRYWLSIAIDRITGKIVDEQLEPVFE